MQGAKVTEKCSSIAAMTIQQAYQQLLLQLYELYDNREAANIADMVIEHVTGQRKIERIMYKDLPVHEQQQNMLSGLSGELLQHKPVQYVLHEAWFCGLKFYVDEHVLIPRPETEELVKWVEEECKIQNSKFKILDIGTGSGCIPISLKKQLPAAEIMGIDVSAGALNVAFKNAQLLNLKVDFKQVDFLNENERDVLELYNIIVSNPPYIKANEEAAMHANVLAFEPHVALFVPDNNALVFYEAIALFGKKHLTPGGKIFLEINEALGKQVVELFTNTGYKNVTLKKDMQGKDRMVRCEFV